MRRFPGAVTAAGAPGDLRLGLIDLRLSAARREGLQAYNGFSKPALTRQVCIAYRPPPFADEDLRRVVQGQSGVVGLDGRDRSGAPDVDRLGKSLRLCWCGGGGKRHDELGASPSRRQASPSVAHRTGHRPLLHAAPSREAGGAVASGRRQRGWPGADDRDAAHHQPPPIPGALGPEVGFGPYRAADRHRCAGDRVAVHALSP